MTEVHRLTICLDVNDSELAHKIGRYLTDVIADHVESEFNSKVVNYDWCVDEIKVDEDPHVMIGRAQKGLGE